jgi:high affinity sulfate transporter 1
MLDLIPLWMRTYRIEFLRQDIFGGLTVAAIVVPKAMACALIAGLPVEVGLYTALATMVVYPFFGSSRVLSVTTTTAIAILTSAQVVKTMSQSTGTNAVDVAAALALMVGAVLILAHIMRLGFMADFISLPVLVGFEAGVGVVILISQMKYLLGVHIDSHSTLGIVQELFGAFPEFHGLTFIIGGVALVVLLFLPRLLPNLSAPLLVIVLSVAASAVFGLQVLGVQSIGNVPTGLPSPRLPDFALAKALVPAALGIALLSFTESIAAARTYSGREDDPIQPNQELFAIGAANLASSLFAGMPSGGGTAQTAVASSAEVQSQMAQWICASVVIICLLLLAPIFSYLPKTVLGAITLMIALHMIKPQKFYAIARIRNIELSWALLTFAGVVLVGTLEGILIAVVISMLTLIYQAAHPPVYAVVKEPKHGFFVRAEDADDALMTEGLLVLRTEGRLNFFNASNAVARMKTLVDKNRPKVVILACGAIPDIEYSALVRLMDGEENLRRSGIMLWLAALNPGVMETIQRSSLANTLGENRIFQDLKSALEAFDKEDVVRGPH